MFLLESTSTQRACAGHPRVRTASEAASMDAVLPTEAEVMEPGPGKERRRRTIQFTVPPPSSAPAQLDSRQVEMVSVCMCVCVCVCYCMFGSVLIMQGLSSRMSLVE